MVPYNLFLHASSVSERWRDLPTDEPLLVCRLETALAVGRGDLATRLIMTKATSVEGAGREIRTAGDYSKAFTSRMASDLDEKKPTSGVKLSALAESGSQLD